MKFKDMKCIKCGRNAMEAAEKGAYLERTNIKGKLFKGQCKPGCFGDYGTQENALLNAIDPQQEKP